MIVIFMAQLHPTGDLTLDHAVHALAYQAINDQQAAEEIDFAPDFGWRSASALR